MSVDSGMEMPCAGAENPKRGAQIHRLGAKAGIVTSVCYSFGTKDSFESRL
jgi:hypothetical protein